MQIALAGYRAFRRDFRLEEGLSRTTLEELFTSLASSPNAKLNRSEWVSLLVRLAIIKHLKGEKGVVHEAVAKFMSSTILRRVRHAPERLEFDFKAADEFRAFLYTEEVDTVLKLHKHVLRSIYDKCSIAEQSTHAAANRLSLREWRMFLMAFDLYGEDFSAGRDDHLCFVFARMLVRNSNLTSETAHSKLTQLSFEDVRTVPRVPSWFPVEPRHGHRSDFFLLCVQFLEAICRVATLKALPTKEECNERSVGDAHEFMVALRVSPNTHVEWVRHHCGYWGSTTPRQPIAQCVSALCSILSASWPSLQESSELFMLPPMSPLPDVADLRAAGRQQDESCAAEIADQGREIELDDLVALPIAPDKVAAETKKRARETVTLGNVSVRIVDGHAAIPSSVSQIDNFAFLGCTSLSSVDIPSSVTQIGRSAFKGCSSLKSMEIPSSVKQIGAFAFAGCLSLTSVELASSFTQLGEGAFHRCDTLVTRDSRLKAMLGRGPRS